MNHISIPDFIHMNVIVYALLQSMNLTYLLNTAYSSVNYHQQNVEQQVLFLLLTCKSFNIKLSFTRTVFLLKQMICSMYQVMLYHFRASNYVVISNDNVVHIIPSFTYRIQPAWLVCISIHVLT